MLVISLKPEDKVNAQFSPNPFIDNFDLKVQETIDLTADTIVANILGKAVMNKKIV